VKNEKKILIPGLGVGKSMGLCDACNMAFGELFVNPSLLLWVDRICIPKWCIDYHPDSGERESKGDFAVRMLIDTLGENKLLECIDDETFKSYGKTISGIGDFVAAEMRELSVAENVRFSEKDRFLKLGGEDFCAPYLTSNYASALFAHKIGARCLFDHKFRSYINLRNRNFSAVISGQEIVQVRNEIFTAALPNDFKMPNYIFTDPKICSKCTKEGRCGQELATKLRECFDTVLDVRNYDEFHLLRGVVDEVLVRGDKCGWNFTSKEILSELQAKAKEIQKKEKSRFPKVERWANFVMAFSLPVSFAALQMGEPITATLAGGAVAAAKTADWILKFSKSRNRWVDFFNKNKMSVKSSC